MEAGIVEERARDVRHRVERWLWAWVGLCVLSVIACSAPPQPEAEAPQQAVVVDVPTPPIETAQEEEAAKPDSEPSVESPIPVTTEDPSWGAEDALVTLVMFGDLQCPFCARVWPTVAKLKEEYGPRDLRVVWKNNPLPFHKQAAPAHRAAVAVHKLAGSDAAWQFNSRAFERQKALTPENLSSWAGQLGVGRGEFQREMSAARTEEKVQRDIQLAKSLGALGTPAFRINGVTLSGAQPIQKFRKVIDEQLSLARAGLQRGVPRAHISAEATRKNLVLPDPEENKPTKKKEEDKTVWAIPVDKVDPQLGPADALVTIVEFGDFQCPFCARVQPTLDALRTKYGKDLRIVWKDNPLPFHTEAKAAAKLARYIKKYQGNAGFWKAHDLLLDKQRNFKGAAFEDIVSSFGYSWQRAQPVIEGTTFDPLITAGMDLAQDYNARGTPHFFINGRRLGGAQPQEVFEALVDEQLQIARDLVSQGTPRARVYDKLMKAGKTPPPPASSPVPAILATTPSRGPKNAPIVITEFGDFQCPYCKRAQPTLETLMKNHPGKIRIVFHHFPLPFHKDAVLAAEATVEARAQLGDKGFWAYHDLLFANQLALERSDLDSYAQQLGLDMARFATALDNRTHRAIVEADIAAGKQSGVTGTPKFLVNGYVVSGAQPVEAFERMIKYALTHGKPRPAPSP